MISTHIQYLCAYYSFRHGRVFKCIMLALNTTFLLDCWRVCWNEGPEWECRWMREKRWKFFGFKPYHYSRAIRAKHSAGETSCDKRNNASRSLHCRGVIWGFWHCSCTSVWSSSMSGMPCILAGHLHMQWTVKCCHIYLVSGDLTFKCNE